jgi:hypothetical protein
MLTQYLVDKEGNIFCEQRRILTKSGFLEVPFINEWAKIIHSMAHYTYLFPYEILYSLYFLWYLLAAIFIPISILGIANQYLMYSQRYRSILEISSLKNRHP